MQSLYITWDIDPAIVNIGFFQLRWYGVLFASSFFFGYIILKRLFIREEIPIKLLDQLVLYMGIGTLSGARLGHCLFYEPISYLKNPLEIFMLWKGGLASHGAAMGILLSLLLFAVLKKTNYLWLLDRIVIGVALSGFLIRLGNFTNSEILGKVTDVPWAIVFPAYDNLPRHPAQMYEALVCLVVFGLLLLAYFKFKAGEKKGLLFSIFLIIIFGLRIIIEFYKVKQVTAEENLPINFGQIYSIPFVVAGLVLFIIVITRKTKDKSQ